MHHEREVVEMERRRILKNLELHKIEYISGEASFEDANTVSAGGRRLNTPGGKAVGFVGAPPKRIAISEWASLEAVQKFYNSDAFTKLAPQRDKAAAAMADRLFHRQPLRFQVLAGHDNVDVIAAPQAMVGD